MFALGQKHATNREYYSFEALMIADEWRRFFDQKAEVEQRTIDANKAYYEAIQAYYRLKCEKCSSRTRYIMKASVPWPYVVALALFSVISSVFGVLLVLAFSLGYITINPWVLIILFVGSIGMLATTVFALKDWRKSV